MTPAATTPARHAWLGDRWRDAGSGMSGRGANGSDSLGGVRMVFMGDSWAVRSISPVQHLASPRPCKWRVLAHPPGIADGNASIHAGQRRFPVQTRGLPLCLSHAQSARSASAALAMACAGVTTPAPRANSLEPTRAPTRERQFPLLPGAAAGTAVTFLPPWHQHPMISFKTSGGHPGSRVTGSRKTTADGVKCRPGERPAR